MSAPAAAAARKPLDVGNGLVCASFGAGGSLLSLGATHPQHGFVELTSLPPFDEEQRGDPSATRAYRASMADERYAAIRLEVDGAPLAGSLVADASDPYRPRWVGRAGPVAIEAFALADASHPTVRQRWRLAADDRARAPLRLRLRGRLDRPALAEITETDPPRPIGATTARHVAGRAIRLESPALPASAAIVVDGGKGGAWRMTGADEAMLDIGWADGSRELTIEIAATIAAGDAPAPAPEGVGGSAASARPATASTGAGRIVRRALAYVGGCTAMATAPDERTILTDHRLLPLSWTRDAYYQALLLLVAGAPDGTERVADHLRWLWRRCERPDGRWVRSHHANGRRKDLAFQADQQLYPIVELADYWRATGTLPSGVDWTDAVAIAWSAAARAVDPQLGLMASAENAADDPAIAPFIAGSQMMLWYAAQRLAELCDEQALALDPAAFRAIATSVEGAFERHLLHDGRWAYATDGRGLRIAYHDANDLPIALAPAWGFCAADDPAWRNTMAFAFSTANPGYAPGPTPGLGSAHTRGPWTLGDVQAWLRAVLTGDSAAGTAALRRLEQVSYEDGMLPEAYVAADGGEITRIRHWFAWPGAAFAALWTLAERGELMDRLRVTPERPTDRSRSPV